MHFFQSRNGFMAQFKALEKNRKLWRELLLCSTGSLPVCNTSSKLTAILMHLSLDGQMHLKIQEW